MNTSRFDAERAVNRLSIRSGDARFRIIGEVGSLANSHMRSQVLGLRRFRGGG